VPQAPGTVDGGGPTGLLADGAVEDGGGGGAVVLAEDTVAGALEDGVADGGGGVSLPEQPASAGSARQAAANGHHEVDRDTAHPFSGV